MLRKDEEIKTDSINYLAPNPYSQSSAGFVKAFTHFVYSIRSVSHSQSVGKIVVPALFREPLVLKKETMAQLPIYQIKVTRTNIQTHDDAQLDGIEINQSEKKSNIHIIKFNGNGALYEEQLEQFAKDALRLNATVVAFNYRGVGHSKNLPNCSQNLITDGIAEVQRILDKGVLPKDIVLDGLSLGGGIATLVAKHFYDKGIKVNLFNDRSFSSLSNAATHMLHNLLPKELPKFIDQISETSIYSSIYSSVSVADWEIDAARAYESIPDKNKTHMYVTDDAKTYPNNKGDGVIPEKASLHSGLKSSSSFFKMTCDSPQGGHNVSRKALKSVLDGLDGEQVFDSFVKRVTR